MTEEIRTARLLNDLSDKRECIFIDCKCLLDSAYLLQRNSTLDLVFSMPYSLLVSHTVIHLGFVIYLCSKRAEESTVAAN